MRVQGNIIPEPITVEHYMPMAGYAEVRLRENVQEVVTHDNMTDTDIIMYEYDEYVTHAKDKDRLLDEIRSNIDEWLATGRGIEVNESASLVRVGKEKSERILTEAVTLAQSSTEIPSATVGVLIDGIEPWEPGRVYEKLYTLFVYDGKVGFTRQSGITASEVYPPFSIGTEALYGVRPAPDDQGVYPYVYNMAAKIGMRVREDGIIYICTQDLDAMLYPPSQIPAHFSEV